MKKNLKAEMLMGLCMLMLVAAVSRYMARSTETAATVSSPQKVVVLDAGHGGKDPGKIGINNALEKDINLAIVKQIQYYLENDSVTVVLTRDSDAGLYQESDGNKKQADMKKRCEIIDQSGASLVVSIHQNSYHEESVSGAQVFYYKASEQGKQLAELIQKRFDSILGERNTKGTRPNDNYYLLLHTSCPTVIVECGFLSNWEETVRLTEADYQHGIAWTEYIRIMQYLNGL